MNNNEARLRQMESNELYLSQAIAERDTQLQALCKQVNEERHEAKLEQERFARLLEEKMANLQLEHERELDKTKAEYNEELQKQQHDLQMLQLKLEHSQVRFCRPLNAPPDLLRRLRRRTSWRHRFRTT